MALTPGTRAGRGVGLAALAVAVAWLAFAIPRLSDYGPTWDCVLGEYAQGEQVLAWLESGDDAYLDFSRDPDGIVSRTLKTPRAAAPAVGAARPDGGRDAPRPAHRAPHMAYPDWLYDWYEAHPLGGLASALACRVLWDAWGLLPSMSAHHLPIVLCVAALLFALVRFAGARAGLLAGVATALALLLSPRFLCDAMGNLKDAPEACLYALAALAWWRALLVPAAGAFALAGAATGLAYAQKVNAGFLLPQLVAAWALASLARRRAGRPAIAFPWRGLAVAVPVAAATLLAVSPMLWPAPLERFALQLRYFLDQGVQGYVTQAFDGARQVLVTTPPVVLALAAIGLVSRRIDAETRAFLAVGVAVPVGRVSLPGSVNFDGVRHFLEFMPFLALLAGVGTAELVARAQALVPAPRAGTALLGTAALFAAPAWAAADTWPHGNCYGNAFIGGLAGAQARGEASATDYWGASYWQGLQWLSARAEPGASVLVPVAWHVARAAAPIVLRPDLALLSEPPATPPAVLYVMHVTHEAFYGSLTWELAEHDPPVHAIRVQGAPILMIHRLEGEAARAALDEWWSGLDPAAARRRLAAWLDGTAPELRAEVEALMELAVRAPAPEHLLRLRDLLPARLQRDVALLLQVSARQAARAAAPPAEGADGDGPEGDRLVEPGRPAPAARGPGTPR